MFWKGDLETMSDNIIKVSGLKKHYFDGKIKALDGVDLEVKKGEVIVIIGPSGCGKTTMLMGMIENIYETMNLRITETAFELHLRKIYPTRNIVSMRETETISGQDCLDVQKKTDGSVNIIGEVATDPVASWMIQSAQVASKFTLFTHHAKTFPDLVTALRNSMLRAGVFKNERTAEAFGKRGHPRPDLQLLPRTGPH